MYIQIANQFPTNFPYADFLKTELVCMKSDIEKKLSKYKNVVAYDFKTQPTYPGETYFIGFGNKSKWISLNLIENSNKLFLHTTMTCSLQDVSANYAMQGFMKYKGNTKLYKIGDIKLDTVPNLIANVNVVVNQLH